ncbi:MAG: ribonuclease H-like domain-containing protein [Candidatus Liptonbacteria bacterium]|nr:ribonuclease H-like domain-containing protein [Candidatus Liptonbacteria bacterium]
MDTIVFDIETQNFFTDPDVGWNNFGALKISVIGLYSYEKDAYASFEESELEDAAEFFRNASRLVGFSINRYDVPVLVNYFNKFKDQEGLDLWHKERVDLLEEIEMATGSRVSLGKLAEANLGEGKTGHGWEAISLYKHGEIQKLKDYCLQDVRLTKELYDIYKKKGELVVPKKITGELVSVRLRTPEPAQATLL